MRGMFVRGTSGTSLVCTAVGWAAPALPVIAGSSTSVLAMTATMAADRLNFFNIPRLPHLVPVCPGTGAAHEMYGVSLIMSTEQIPHAAW